MIRQGYIKNILMNQELMDPPPQTPILYFCLINVGHIGIAKTSLSANQLLGRYFSY
jgi:hypothetical protein